MKKLIFVLVLIPSFAMAKCNVLMAQKVMKNEITSSVSKFVSEKSFKLISKRDEYDVVTSISMNNDIGDEIGHGYYLIAKIDKNSCKLQTALTVSL